MWRYILRRLLQTIPLLFLVSISVFAMMHLVPGGPMGVYGKNPNLTPEALKNLEAKLGLDQPLHIQYLRWLGKAVQGDFGYSYDTKRPALREIADRLPATLYLMLFTFFAVLLVSIPLGIISALKQYSALDLIVTGLSFAGQALPVFWIGLVLMLIFYAWLKNPATGKGLLPASGMYTLGQPFSIVDWAKHLVLPSLTLGLAWVSWYSRYVRASMLEVINSDYIRTARAKGLNERRVVFLHALKNAAIPVVTVVAMDLPTVFGGALYVEQIFSWPGMGRLFFRAAERRDYPVLMAVVMISAVLIILSNLLADIVYAYLDPRIRYD
ncbi:MAG: ABC transporter permease [Anaerolineae bacterium]